MHIVRLDRLCQLWLIPHRRTMLSMIPRSKCFLVRGAKYSMPLGVANGHHGGIGAVSRAFSTSRPHYRLLDHALPSSNHPAPSLIIFGSAAIDLQSRAPTDIIPRSTTPGVISVSPGGVGRNMAEAAQTLLPPHTVKLVYTAAKDALGDLLQLEMEAVGLRTDGLIQLDNGLATAACSLFLDSNGDLTGGVSDMGIVESLPIEEIDRSVQIHGHAIPRLLLFDCNLTTEAIEAVIRIGRKLNIPIFCEPTSTPKLPRALEAIKKSGARIDHITPNTLELAAIASTLQSSDRGPKTLGPRSSDHIRTWTDTPEKRWIWEERVFDNALAASAYCTTFWVKNGDKGVVRISAGSEAACELAVLVGDGLYLNATFHPPIPIDAKHVLSTTGAGDTLAGCIAAALVKGSSEKATVLGAMRAVDKTLRSQRAVG